MTILPGDLGGVETPMALAGGRLFVPWLDLATASASGRRRRHRALKRGRGGLTAVDAATGTVAWQHALPSMDFGAATVANDVVFTSTYAGTIYAFDTADRQAAVEGQGAGRDQLLPGDRRRHAARRRRGAGLQEKPQFQLVAYSLS